MKLKRLLTLAIITASTSISSGLLRMSEALAEESVTNKVQDKAGDAVTKTKHLARKAKKKVRDATGNHSTKEDIKDKAKDVGDSIDNSATKIERDINEKKKQK